jgi:hypothetical protein
VLTERARRRLAGMVNTDGDSIAGAAAAFGVGWHAANRAVADHTDPAIDDPGRLDGVEAIGVDEKRFGNATRWNHRRLMGTTTPTDKEEAYYRQNTANEAMTLKT